MPQRFFTANDLHRHGLTPADVRGAPRKLHETWRLSPTATELLKGLLTRTGFDPTDPIHVHESPDPAGFVFTQ